MKSSSSRTITGGLSNRTILFLLLLVVGDLGIQTNSRVMAGSIFSKKTGESTKDYDPNPEFAERTISLAKSILECYELFNKAASTGMNQTQWTNLQKKMKTMNTKFFFFNHAFNEPMTSKIIDSEMEKIYRQALANFFKLRAKLDTHNIENDFALPYEPLEPNDMQINANCFELSAWWKKMSKTKKFALIGSIAGIALLTGSISAYFGIRHLMSSDQNDLSMKQTKQPVINERLVAKKDEQKSGGTTMLVVVLLIAMAIGLSLVTYLYVRYLRNQVDTNAPSQPKSNKPKSEGSTSTTIITENPHNNHQDKSSKEKQTKSPKSNGELKSNSSANNSFI